MIYPMIRAGLRSTTSHTKCSRCGSRRFSRSRNCMIRDAVLRLECHCYTCLGHRVSKSFLTGCCIEVSPKQICGPLSLHMGDELHWVHNEGTQANCAS